MVRRINKQEHHTHTAIDFDHTNDESPPSTLRMQQNYPSKPSAYRSKNQPQCMEILKSRLFISLFIVSSLIITLLCIGLVVIYDIADDPNQSEPILPPSSAVNLVPEQMEWFASADRELNEALRVEPNRKRARNVILFVGDGMGPNTVTAARIYKHGEGGLLSWEEFPHMGLLKTYCADKQVPDSTATATALFGGVKANYHTSGVDSTVAEDDCKASLNVNHHVDSLLKWAQEAGLGTGFVTTTRVMHATPASLYSHTANRKWECEATMPDDVKRMGCKDIARQLIENLPGKNINVIMGGGRQCLVSNVTGTTADPIDTWSCVSQDGRNLIQDWKREKQSRGARNAVVQNNDELVRLEAKNYEYLLGIFANGHLRYDDELDHEPSGMPTLKQMTDTAITVLTKNPLGFVLIVEGGLIDQAHHRGWARRALSETVAMDEAVRSSMDLMKSKLDETLIIVTSDHAHSLTINGYPKKGNDILGIAQNSKSDGIPYTTLTYATGHYGYQNEVGSDGKVQRVDPTKTNTSAYDYVQQVTVFTDENAHAGNDVLVYAKGPWSHLFHKVHEQSYVTHAISYAAKIGRFSDKR